MSSIDKFIDAITTHHFIEAHELLEHDWKEYKKMQMKKEAKALQGLINGATALALFHIKKRPEAYTKVWPVFIKYKELLDEIDIEEIEKYKEAKNLLLKKNEELVTI